VIAIQEDVVTFPDRIERTIELPQGPDQVWAALTTAEGLSGWFGTVAEIDLRPGADFDLHFEKEGGTANLRIAAVEPPRRFAYEWGLVTLPPDDPRRTLVEFLLEATATGTRLTVTETGFAQVPDDLGEQAHKMNTQGWTIKLDELAAYLNVVRS
jgi:uncharacterized protein YndB with AHSA1/START domain